ncbi:SHOCT domain-containing protein [Metabacillus fastidiosus]|uniref:SHOCT domain-containing protein n=1 Tax=Metabacillus fastidiosus TaxID=1458 RepID=UPI003D265688
MTTLRTFYRSFVKRYRKLERIKHHPSSNIGASKKDDKYEKLAQLGNLRDQGALTEEEFNAEKKQLLGL